MNGNLEPEENVMTDRLWTDGGMMDIIQEKIKTLGWEPWDDIRVEIGGVAFSGINQTEGANPKWAKPYGTISYQNDAFIVIKNRSRNPVVPSQSSK